MTSSLLYHIHLTDLVLFVVFLYIVLFILLLWIRYCVQYGIFCPYSPTKIHCCIIPQNQKDFCHVCTTCAMKKSPFPSFCRCCHRKHNLYVRIHL
ncbi:hypothetical protein Zmor_016799 [Zophobas morio]|uniref:Uncharacterized protein n=1 Tax=Zophobas morio TaxID=2755281 RepID=A0AA38I7L8_9CUCU|nr:hypothetical protein Zmor_016799 [Zophobas morio]